MTFKGELTLNGNSMIKDYTSGNITKQLLIFSAPLFLSNLLQTAYNLVDMAVVGRFCGSAVLGGVSSGTDIMHFFTFVGIGMTSAGQILISQYVGMRDTGGIRRMIGTMFTAAVVLALAMSAVGFLCIDSALGWLNVPSEALDSARAYSVTCFSGLLFSFLYFTVSSILRGMGDSTRPLIFIGICAVLNIVLDVVFVLNGMGAFGAALATVISQAVSCVVSIAYLVVKREEFGFDFKPRSFIPGRRQLQMLSGQGVPQILQSCAISLSTMFVSSYINSYGVTALAVTGIGGKLFTVILIVTVALNVSGSSLIGQNFAAGKFDRVSRIVWDVLFICFGFCAVCALGIYLFPEQVFSIFNTDPEVLAMCHSYSIVIVVNFLAAGMRSPFTALTNGIGFASLSMAMAMLDGIVLRIGLALLWGVAMGYGLMGLWMGSAVAGATIFFIGMPYFLSGRWKKRIPPVAR